MNDYRLDKTGQEVDNILNGAAMQTDLTAETERAELAEQTLQGNIDNEVLARQQADQTLQGNIDAETLARQGDVSDEETRAKAAEKANADNIALAQQAIEAILLLIPSAATALNQLADKSFVNSSISTATATFRGTYNLVTDLSLSLSATHQQIGAALAGAIATADNNDYAFVQIPTSVDTPTEIAVTERYKFNGSAWEYEYDLNNSGFTSAQWEAINSGITALLVTKLGALPTAAELATALNGKQNVLTFDNVPVSGSDNPVKSGGLYQLFAAIDAMTPTGAGTNNKLVAEDRLTSYVTGIINALDATFDLTSADGHVTFKMTQVDGLITSVQILTSDIASASQVSTNTADIAALQAAYAGLTQSDIVVVNGALPSSGQQQNVIYRQPDPDHTPPQFYSDYMWNGSTWVLMATYNNAIDAVPTAGSHNLVESGGVQNELALGAVYDVSAKNPTAGPNNDGKFESLAALLSDVNLNTLIPTSVRNGGMSIKFVQSSDNKYVQYRLMSNTWSTTESDWQGVDEEPMAGSSNLVESGGVEKIYDYINRIPKSVHSYIDNLVRDATRYVSCGDIILNKNYNIHYKNSSNSRIGIGLAYNGTLVEALGTIDGNSEGDLTFKTSVSINQLRLYIYTTDNSGKADFWTIAEEDLLITKKELDNVEDNVESEIEALDQRVDSLEGIVDVGVELNGYYYVSSLISTDGKRRAPIDVTSLIGTYIKVKISNINSGSSRMTGFTNDVSDLSNIQWTDAYTENEFESNVFKKILVTGKYLLISYKTSSEVTCIESDNLIDTVKDHTKSIDDLQTVVETHFPYSSLNVELEKRVGDVTILKNYAFIKGHKYTVHYISGISSSMQFRTANNGTVVFENGVYEIAANTTSVFSFIAEEDASQIRLWSNFSETVNGNIKFIIESPDSNPLANIDKLPTFITCFKKISCIGDSLTEGAYNRNDGGAEYATIREYSYPVFMQRHTGIDTRNLGISGSCAGREIGSWYDSAVSLGYMTSDNIGDIAIIALGTNDIDRYGSFTGDVQTDIDLNDRNNNARTSVGGYANIIQALKEIRPRMTIFCVTISNERNSVEKRTEANNKIKAIAALFDDCYVIDLQTYAEPTETEQDYFKAHYKNSTHNNALGYELRSRQYISYIDWIIENNLDAFCNLQFIDTNYYYNK